MSQDRTCCDRKCLENQGRGTCPRYPDQPLTRDEARSFWRTVLAAFGAGCIVVAVLWATT